MIIIALVRVVSSIIFRDAIKNISLFNFYNKVKIIKNILLYYYKKECKHNDACNSFFPLR